MTGAAEEIGKATGSFFDSMKREPLSLALVIMNIALLTFFYFLLTIVAAQREREVSLLYADHKEVRDLLARCIVPERRSEDERDPTGLVIPIK